MKIRDYLTIGLKLLGFYFAVHGLTAVAVMIVNLAIQITESEGYSPPTATTRFLSFAQPLAYLICAFILIKRTEWCLKFSGSPPEGP